MPAEINALTAGLLFAYVGIATLILLVYSLTMRVRMLEATQGWPQPAGGSTAPVWTPAFNPPLQKVDSDGNKYDPPVILFKLDRSGSVHSYVVAQYLNGKWVDFETCKPIIDSPRFWLPIEMGEDIEAKYSLALAADQRRIEAAKRTPPPRH